MTKSSIDESFPEYLLEISISKNSIFGKVISVLMSIKRQFRIAQTASKLVRKGRVIEAKELVSSKDALPRDGKQ